MAIQVKGQTNLLTSKPHVALSLTAATSHIWLSCQAVFIWYMVVSIISNVRLKKVTSSSALTCGSTQEQTTGMCVCVCVLVISHRFGLFVSSEKELIIRKSILSLRSIANCYIVRHPQTLDQMMSCTINSLRVSPFLSCVSQHMLPLLICVMVLGTASLSQFWYTMCVCNECVCVECVSTQLCARENICVGPMRSPSFCTVHVWESVDAGDVMLFVWACVFVRVAAVNLSLLFYVFVCVCVCFIWLGR